MAVFVAFLRGVNVKGTPMKMADLVSVFTNLGLLNVTAVLATGNIIFESSKTADVLKFELEQALSKQFNYEAFLFIKTKEELLIMVDGCPFGGLENEHRYIFIGESNVAEILQSEFDKTANKTTEKGTVVNHIFYWQVPKGNTLQSNFGKILGRKSLKDQFTSRNLNTIEKIINKI